MQRRFIYLTLNYIALAIKNTELSKHLTQLELLGKEFDIKLIANNGIASIDTEIAEGLNAFSHKFELTAVQATRLSTYSKSTTSSSIAESLTNLFLKGEKSNFVDFILSAKQYLPNEFYLVFAFEWGQGEYVRFINMELSELEEYFKCNNGWELWLYDYVKDFYVADLDTPLIIRISNKAA